MSDPDFLHEASTATEAQWRALVDKALKGGDFERVLTSTTAEGIRIRPLYPKSDAAPVAGRAAATPWVVMQRLDHPDILQANAQALDDLEGGATGLALVVPGAVGDYGFGLSAAEDRLAALLEGVRLDWGVAIALDAGASGPELALRLAGEAGRLSIDPAKTGIDFAIDPFAAGAPPAGWGDGFTQAVARLRATGFTGRMAVADARRVHAAGGTAADELAFALSAALALLRTLESAGIPLDAARDLIGFRLAADADQFMTMAKFRALRRLWAEVEAACGLAPRPTRVTAETAWRMMTRRDPWTNLLRTTIAVAAAGMAGADAIVCLPFTQALGLPDGFARRLARNLQTILIEESNLHQVADPAAGAGGIEALTDDLAARGWEGFQAIEAEGGLAAALASGGFAARVAAARKALEKDVARRKAPITGTSEFPSIAEAPVAVLQAIARTAEPASFLPAFRLSEPFEALRDRGEAFRDAKGNPPRIFLATLGSPARFTPRATFARNFFEAGGVHALLGQGYPDTAAMVAAFRDCGARAACLCGTDDDYAAGAAEAAGALKVAGAETVLLAGRPGASEAALKAAGVEDFIFAGADALAVLTRLQARLGVPA